MNELIGRKASHLIGALLLLTVGSWAVSHTVIHAWEEDANPAIAWSGSSVTWYVNDDVDDLTGSGKLYASIAANHWDDNNVPGSDLDFSEGSTYSSSDVRIHKGDACGPCGPAQTIRDLFSTTIVDAEIRLDPDFDWNTSGVMDSGASPPEVDVFTVTVHELGHAMGFAHRLDLLDSCDSNNSTGEGFIQENSVMCTNNPWAAKSGLNSEDKDGQAIKYP